MQERRDNPRHEIGFEVDLTHPSFGTRRCHAGNLSDGGLLVYIDGVSLARGARVSLRPVPQDPLASQSVPTVQMEVVRAAADSVGLRFASHAAEHLWHAAHTALAGNLDEAMLVRVYHAAAVLRAGRLLLLRDGARWALPGAFLPLKMSVDEHLRALVADHCGIEVDVQGPLLTSVVPGQTPLYVCYVRCDAPDDARVALRGRWREHRWLQRANDAEKLELVDGRVRRLAQLLLPTSGRHP